MSEAFANGTPHVRGCCGGDGCRVEWRQRWKEKFFVNVGADCGLTIAGFYYICCSRADGSITGFYYDPNSR